MPIPWGVIIALGVLTFAYIIKKFLSEVIEEERVFLIIIGCFFVVYVVAAFAVGSLDPLHFVEA